MALTTVAVAQPKHPYDDALEALKQRNAAEHAAPGNPDRKVWDYVIADKKAGTVTVMACGSVIKPTDPVEFFLCTTTSGKDYESLAVTPAKPSDIKAAMEFIGLRPGLPIDPEKNRYWPRGQRVTLSFNLNGKPTRAEDLVQDTNTKSSLPKSGLVFTGSYKRTDEAGKTFLAADVLDAKPIAPLYNDPAALLDVPRQAVQSTVYGFQKPSAAFTLKAGEAVDLTFAAAKDKEDVQEWSAEVRIRMGDGDRRDVMALSVNFKSSPHGRDLRANEMISVGSISALLDTLAEESKRQLGVLRHVTPRKTATQADGGTLDFGGDVFTSVQCAANVPVRRLRQLYAILQTVESDHGIKLDPPAEGELFHRAFFPKPEWRDRATRLGEPWELFLTRNAADKINAKLERAVDNPDRSDDSPKYVVESTVPENPAAFVKTVNDKASRWSKAIFVYPPADLTYGELMEWVRPVLATYPRVFVFPAEEAGDKAATQPATTRTLETK